MTEFIDVDARKAGRRYCPCGGWVLLVACGEHRWAVAEECRVCGYVVVLEVQCPEPGCGFTPEAGL